MNEAAVLSRPSTRKPCANQHCARLVPLNWTYCKDRVCQTTRVSPEYRAWMQQRHAIEQQRMRVRNSTPEARARRARWKADHPEMVAAQQRRYQVRLAKIGEYLGDAPRLTCGWP